MVCSVITLSQRQILDFSKLKEFADDNFRLDETGRKFSKRVENTVGLPDFACSFIWDSTKSAQIIDLGSNLAPPRGSLVLHWPI